MKKTKHKNAQTNTLLNYNAREICRESEGKIFKARTSITSIKSKLAINILWDYQT